MSSNNASVNNLIAHRLREIRIERGLTSSEVALRTGIAPGSYSCLENGWYKINLDNLFKILHALQAKVTDVWPRTEGIDGPVDNEYVRRAVRQAREMMPRRMALDDLYDAVCRAFEVPKDKLLAGSKWKRLQEARAVCGLLAREVAGVQQRSLAQSLQVSESGLSHLMSRHQRRLAEDCEFASRLDAARQILLESIQHPLAKERRKAS